MPAKMSVNINKIATLRNSRGGNVPNVLQVALDCIRFGAEGITVHPRPDERHITTKDVHDLAPRMSVEFNIEGYPDQRYLDMVAQFKPAQATLVPDGPYVLTSNAGWDTVKHQAYLTDIVSQLKASGTRVSIFVDPDPSMVAAAKATGADRIELYTEAYAAHYPTDPAAAIKPYLAAAKEAELVGLGLNAGHDLSLVNLGYFAQQLPNLLEVSIGHALIADAFYLGLDNTINLYKNKLAWGE